MKKLVLSVFAAASLASAEALVVGATPIPHAEILEHIKPDLAAAGFELEVKVINDYVIPNKFLESGELDANFMQHVPYLREFNANNGTHLTETVGVHLEPMGVYSHKIKSLKELKDGAKIAIPNDPTNESRALDLLVAQGLIKVDTKIKLRTPLDVIENPKKLEFLELDAPTLPRTLGEVDAAVINSNYAFNANLSPVKDALAIEDAKGNPYTNVVAVKIGNENSPKTKALNKAITSAKVKAFIEKHYNGAIVPAF